MSAQPATSRKSHNYENDRAEQYARYRRRDHANLESMVNLIISAIAEETGIEMPPKCRHLLSAIQGAHGGGQVIEQEFERDYLTLAAQLQFSGSEDARRARVRDWLDALESWQTKNYLLVTVIKGGKIIRFEADGTPIRTRTTFIDHLLPVADDAVMRARASVQWCGDAKEKIKAHPGLALAAQVEWAVKQLGRHPEYKAPDEVTDEESGKESKTFSLSEYVARRQDIMLAENQRILGKLKDDEPMDVDEIDARLATLETFYARSRKDIDLGYESARSALMSLRDSRCARMMDSTDPAEIAREVDARIKAGVRSGNEPAPTELELCDSHFAETVPAPPNTTHASGKDYKCDFPAPETLEETVIAEALGGKKHTQSTAKTPAKPHVFAPEKLEWALWWARKGLPVVPLHTIVEGKCTCKSGAECRTPGKHPRWHKDDLPHGADNATMNEAQITKWWKRWPSANIAGAMGGSLRLLAVDVDPRSGGDANLCSLVEAHGDEWLNTLHHKTGSGGDHFFFAIPEGVEFTKGKLAEGIDLKWEGGLAVLPPSLHLSGDLYSIADAHEVKTAPAWLLEELTRAADVPPSVVVDLQERRRQAGCYGTRTFHEGERNNGLRDVAYGRWVNGWAESEADLIAQVLEVNAVRCIPPLAEDEAIGLARSASRKAARGERRQEAAL